MLEDEDVGKVKRTVCVKIWRRGIIWRVGSYE